MVLINTDQQQQLNEQYAKEQEMAMNLPVHRRRRSSADTHRHNRLNDPFKHPSSYHQNPGGEYTTSMPKYYDNMIVLLHFSQRSYKSE